jgi:hypothetical protein
MFAQTLVWSRKETKTMEYLIVFATAAMIALYAFIVGRCLPKN